ncbi:hypothetical protein HMI55_004891 [Coelomomyces lativittatus]|nr:hypothetical protein HMI55_004891 [Coelomomyces lativittatus]
MNSFSSSPLFLPQSNSISFSILSLFHYLDLLHQPKKNALSLFTTQRLHGLSLTSSTSFIREWALAFDVLLKTSIQSDIKSINDLSLHSQKVSLVLDEIVYDLRLENQIELAHQFENCIQRLLSLFQSKTIHLGFSYLIYSLPTENSFRMCDGHTLASLLIVFRELAACSYHTTTNDTSIFSNSHQNEENSLIYPSLSVPFGQNQMENESLKSLTLNSMFPSLSSSSSLPLPSSVHGLESMIPYAILSENPTLRSKHFRDPWGVLYTLSDFQLPISKTFQHSLKNSPFSTSLNAPPLPSLDKSPFFLESLLSSTPTISTTHFASLPLDAKLKLPVLDSVHPSSILDSISLPSPSEIYS